MAIDLDSAELSAMQAFVERRARELVNLICRLVEVESPSGDVQASRAVIGLLEDVARTIPSINSIERIILEERAVGGASDGNFAAALNVPVLDGLGVDGDGAHAAHEHIMVTDIARRAALLAGLVATL